MTVLCGLPDKPRHWISPAESIRGNPSGQLRDSVEPDFSICDCPINWLICNMTAVENRFLKEAIRQGLRMQHRFLPEPVLARTGKGYLKSEGVAPLQRIKASLKKSKSGGHNGRAG
jgi:hypothetical protein